MLVWTLEDRYYAYNGRNQTDKKKISLENGIPDDNLSEDVSEIVCRTDVFECGDTPIIDRHIDIEYSFGD